MQNLQTVFEDSLAEVFSPIPDLKKFLESLVPSDRDFAPGFSTIPYSLNYEMTELCNFLNQISEIISETNDVANEIRFKILAYIHIMEADFPLAVIWNLLRIKSGLDATWTFSTISKSGKRICQFPREKINEILKLSKKLGLRIGNDLDSLWSKVIRNSFSHSGYFISGEYFCPTQVLSPVSRIQMGPVKSYSVTEIRDYFNGASNFLSTFISKYAEAIAPFKDGSLYPFGKGRIYWDKRKRWLWESAI